MDFSVIENQILSVWFQITHFNWPFINYHLAVIVWQRRISTIIWKAEYNVLSFFNYIPVWDWIFFIYFNQNNVLQWMKEEAEIRKLPSIKPNIIMVCKSVKQWQSTYWIDFVFKYSDFFIQVCMLTFHNLLLLSMHVSISQFIIVIFKWINKFLLFF